MYRCAVTRKPCKYKGGCAYPNGFPDWAEGVDVVVLKTCAKNFNVYFLGAKDGCMAVWGLNPEWLRRLRRTRCATNGETVRKIMAVCCGAIAEDVNTVCG